LRQTSIFTTLKKTKRKMQKKNRALKKTLSILALAFAAVAGTTGPLEWNGYKAFDRAQGENLLCRADPYCRSLTKGEIELVHTVFGKTVNPHNVKIFNRSYMGIFGRGGAISPNGYVYIDEPELVPDYSVSPELQALLIHEMTHVWQYQQGRNVRLEALRAWRASDYKYKSIYAYDIDAHARFSRYNLEQQAEIVEDYYRARVSFQDGTARYTLAWSCAGMKKLEEKISQVIPLTPQKECKAFPAPPPPKPAAPSS
jgi:hypothetical protein